MADGIYIAMAGAVAQSQGLDVTANNVANASTPGYRAERLRFGEVLARASNDASYAMALGGATDTRQGNLVDTENALDVAINGEGYFAVETDAGARYTRAGNFHTDADGTLVSAEGHAVLGQGGSRILIPPAAQEVIIDTDGSVWADGERVGQIQVVDIASANLVREGNTLYRANGPVNDAAGFEIRQGSLELSNANVVEGVIDLVKVQRTYEALHRLLEAYKQINDRTARTIGGP